jgi:hypothetical protein
VYAKTGPGSAMRKLVIKAYALRSPNAEFSATAVGLHDEGIAASSRIHTTYVKLVELREFWHRTIMSLKMHEYRRLEAERR